MSRKLIVRHCSAIAIIFAFVVALITLPSFLNGEKWRETYSYLALNHGLYWIAIIYLGWLLLTLERPNDLGIPKVRSIIGEDIVITEKMGWLGLGVLTAIYITKDDIERFVCVGEVVNVQTNGLCQIQIKEHAQGSSSMDDAKAALKSVNKIDILIKPGFYKGGGID